MTDVKLECNSLKKAMFNLETVTKIQAGQYLDTTREYINIIDWSIYNATVRTVSRKDRRDDLKTVKDQIDIVYEFAQLMLESKHVDEYITGAAAAQVYKKIKSGNTYCSNFKVRMDFVYKIRLILVNVMPALMNFSRSYQDDSVLLGEITKINEETQERIALLNDGIRQVEESTVIYKNACEKPVMDGDSD